MKKLLWLPIDLPKFPYPEFNRDNLKNWAFWSLGKLTESGATPYAVTSIKQDVMDEYPELESWFRLFPYRNIRNIKFNIQQREVAPHIDFTNPDTDIELFKNNNENEPCGYRILVRGTREQKLYVVDGDNKIYVDLPDDTDVYVLRHSDGLHGVDNDENRTTIFTHFEIDSVAHSSLIERSLNKYSEYAIWSSD